MLLFFAVLVSVPVFAQEAMGKVIDDSAKKISYGLVNVFTGPIEFSCAISEDVRHHGPVGILSGIEKGVFFSLRRFIYGAFELGTFYLPSKGTMTPACQSK